MEKEYLVKVYADCPECKRGFYGQVKRSKLSHFLEKPAYCFKCGSQLINLSRHERNSASLKVLAYDETSKKS